MLYFVNKSKINQSCKQKFIIKISFWFSAHEAKPLNNIERGRKYKEEYKNRERKIVKQERDQNSKEEKYLHYTSRQ